MKKHVLAAIFCAAILAALPGCGGNASESGSASKAETQSGTEKTAPADSESAADESGTETAPAAAAVEYDESWKPADASLNLPALNLGMTTPEMVQRAVMNTGNRARLANVMKKAQNKEAVTIACIGGSITQGTGAKTSQENYAARNLSWWIEAFPDAAFKMQTVNAGIGATGSYIGVHRAERDLLQFNPDVVIVEFSVNDTDPALNFQSYDSLVRKILNQPNQPAVILLFMTQEDGTSLAETHRKIGEAYDLPMISYKNAVLPEINAGTFKWTDISPDNIHPNSNGHGIAAELLWNYYDSVLAELDSIDTSDLSFDIPAISDDKYQNAKILSSGDITPTGLSGFAPAELNMNFPGNWQTETAGEITFETTASNIGILYQRTVDGKCGQYDVYVDDVLQKTLDGNFKDGWGNYAEATEVFSGAEAPHTVTLKAHAGNSADGFQLLGLLTS